MTIYDERQTAACEAMRLALRRILTLAENSLQHIGEDLSDDILTTLIRDAREAKAINYRLMTNDI